MKILVLILSLVAMTIDSLAVTSNGCIQRSPKRSAAAKRAFRKQHPCPSTGKIAGNCPGYEIDHVTPLCCGGTDAPENMRWLTTAEHKNRHSNIVMCITEHPTDSSNVPAAPQ
jgi:hypothetical protein